MTTGHVNVKAMLKLFTAKQFFDWQAYYQLEPFGGERDDLNAANVAQVVANVNRGKNQRPYTLDDMRLKWEQERPERTSEQLFAMLKLIAAAHANDEPGRKVEDL